jgi:hypothetical protein
MAFCSKNEKSQGINKISHNSSAAFRLGFSSLLVELESLELEDESELDE